MTSTPPSPGEVSRFGPNGGKRTLSLWKECQNSRAPRASQGIDKLVSAPSVGSCEAFFTTAAKAVSSSQGSAVAYSPILARKAGTAGSSQNCEGSEGESTHWKGCEESVAANVALLTNEQIDMSFSMAMRLIQWMIFTRLWICWRFSKKGKTFRSQPSIKRSSNVRSCGIGFIPSKIRTQRMSGRRQSFQECALRKRCDRYSALEGRRARNLHFRRLSQLFVRDRPAEPFRREKDSSR